MWPPGFSIRLIGSEDCLKCSSMRKYLEHVKYPYEFFDADKPENQQQLDAWMVIDMPVIQILKDGQSVHQFLPGSVSTKTILTKMSLLGAKR